jgi:hypothetical protein
MPVRTKRIAPLPPSFSFLPSALQPGLELRTHLSRTHGAEIEAAPVPGLAWPGSWLSNSPSFHQAEAQFRSWGLPGQLEADWSCLLANGCACAERVRSEFGALGGTRRRVGEWKRPKAANYHQWAGSPALGFFLLVTGSLAGAPPAAGRSNFHGPSGCFQRSAPAPAGGPGPGTHNIT